MTTRIRSLKPDFFTDEDIATLEPMCRLFYAGLWNHADRAGRLEDRPRHLKAVVFPYDDVDAETFLEALSKPKKYSATQDPFIRRYDVDGRKYIQILAFLRHQRPNAHEAQSAIPAPPDGASTTTHVHARARTEMHVGKGKEGKGKEGNYPPTPQVDKSKKKFDMDAVRQMTIAWNDNMPMGVARASDPQKAPEASKRMLTRINANPWIFEQWTEILHGAQGTYAKMLEEDRADFLTFTWFARKASLAQIEDCKNYRKTKTQRKPVDRSGVPVMDGKGKKK